MEQTYVRGAFDTPKSEAGQRTIALGQIIASELFDHRGRSPYSGDEELVFCSSKGTPLDVGRYGATWKDVLAKAKITDRVRPFHDQRHSALTNAAAVGTGEVALMKQAGHTSFATTRLYVDLTGVMFREEAERSEARLLGERPATVDQPAASERRQ